jgi:hypothetical protein
MATRKYEQRLRADAAATRRRILDAVYEQLRRAPSEPVSVDPMGLYPLNCCCSAVDSYRLLVRYAYLPGLWVVFWYDTEGSPPPSDDLVEAHRGLLDRLCEGDRGADRPFLLGPDGRPDVRVNAFSPRVGCGLGHRSRGRSTRTRWGCG